MLLKPTSFSLMLFHAFESTTTASAVLDIGAGDSVTVECLWQPPPGLHILPSSRSTRVGEVGASLRGWTYVQRCACPRFTHNEHGVVRSHLTFRL